MHHQIQPSCLVSLALFHLHLREWSDLPLLNLPLSNYSLLSVQTPDVLTLFFVFVYLEEMKQQFQAHSQKINISRNLPSALRLEAAAFSLHPLLHIRLLPTLFLLHFELAASLIANHKSTVPLEIKTVTILFCFPHSECCQLFPFYNFVSIQQLLLIPPSDN